MKILSDNNFSDIETAKLPVLIDASATWCGPCQKLTPIVDKISNERIDSLVVYKLDVDESPETSVKLNIKSVPTLILYKGGVEVKRIVGFMTPDKLKVWIDG